MNLAWWVCLLADWLDIAVWVVVCTSCVWGGLLLGIVVDLLFATGVFVYGYGIGWLFIACGWC